jgi:hypothetical protein
LLLELRVGFIAGFRGHKAARSLYRCLDLIVIVFYAEVLKDFTEVSCLRETKGAPRAVTDDFHSKVEVTGAKV